MSNDNNDYHDFVFADGRFVGKFDEMYQKVDDPWPETEVDLQNNVIASYGLKLIEKNKLNNLFFVGLGKGRHANWVKKNIPSVQLEGCEVSRTAVDYCQKHYPDIINHYANAKEFLTNADVIFDVIVFREVLWYILTDWEEIVTSLFKKHKGKYILIEVSTYDDQKYGRNVFDGPNGIIENFPFDIIEIVRHHVDENQKRGMILIFGKI